VRIGATARAKSHQIAPWCDSATKRTRRAKWRPKAETKRGAGADSATATSEASGRLAQIRLKIQYFLNRLNKKIKEASKKQLKYFSFKREALSLG
jgi:hypothetical protein